MPLKEIEKQISKSASPVVKEMGGTRFVFDYIDVSGLVWVESSCQFLFLAEPAFFVFVSLFHAQSKSTIVESCVRRYELPANECAIFVDEIEDKMNALAQQTYSDIRHTTDRIHDLNNLFSSTYLFGSKTITLKCENETIQHYFHPLFSHLKAQELAVDNLSMELFSDNQSLCIQQDVDECECWSKSDIPHFKGSVMGKMLNFIYDKRDADWLMTMHASGISDGCRSILFSAAAGCGKSTVAALLHAQGYELLSDDFIPVDLTGDADRFPMAISVKSGAVETLKPHYPALNEISSLLAGNGKLVQFLPPNPPKVTKDKFPIQAIVFVNYSTEAAFDFSEMSSSDALPILLSEVFVQPELETVRAFMQWVKIIQFYNLTYSDSEAAIRSIKSIFEAHD